MDSIRTAYQDEVHLLVTTYNREFASVESAEAAIAASDLGDGRSRFCVPATDFAAGSTSLARRG